MAKNATLIDIAKAAKLAKGTVSMALNNDPRISITTRKRVLKIAEKMNYYPNESARSLAKGKSESIAFISPRFTSAFVSYILSAVESKAFKTGKYMHGITPYSTRNIITVKDELLRKILYGRKADAVVLITSRPSPEIVLEFKSKGVPLILVENEMVGAHSITMDNINGAYKATSYLIKKYGKNVGLISGEADPPLGEEMHYVSADRLKGYKLALSENMIEYDRSKVQFARHYDYNEGRDCLSNFIKKKVQLDAVFCAAGDVTAMGVMDQAKKEGIKIPQQLAIMGYDNIMSSALLNPPLTTVDQPFEQIGNMVFEMAVDAIEGKLTEEKHVVIEPKLVIRESA
jgi:DNA-binding LacI/PurR family transcriptional regulator